jgi:hypothetical protein
MFDRVGSLRIRRRGPRHVELALTRTTAVAGWALAIVGGAAALTLWPLSLIVAAGPAFVALIGVALITLRREIIIDRDDGLLRMEERMLGLGSRAAVPLFHLRAVVIAGRASTGGARFVATLERRLGGPIHLDEARRCAALLPIGKAIAEVAELRLVYDQTERAAVR